MTFLLLGDGVTMLLQMATQHPYTFPLMCVYFYIPLHFRKYKTCGIKERWIILKKKREKSLLNFTAK